MLKKIYIITSAKTSACWSIGKGWCPGSIILTLLWQLPNVCPCAKQPAKTIAVMTWLSGHTVLAPKGQLWTPPLGPQTNIIMCWRLSDWKESGLVGCSFCDRYANTTHLFPPAHFILLGKSEMLQLTLNVLTFQNNEIFRGLKNAQNK